MPLLEPPPGWGRDELTKFIDLAASNTYATFHNLKADYSKLSGIDATFYKLIHNLYNTKDWFASFFLMRAHSSFLSAVRLTLSGQIPEAYAGLRLTLENALYGFYLAKNPASRHTWLRRHDSEQAKQKVRNEFRIRTLLKTFQAEDAAEGSAVENLYERTIDYGAHPNERALSQSLGMGRGGGKVRFQIIYLNGERSALREALRDAARIGACALAMFRAVYKERFDLLGLTATLHQLRQGL